MMVPDPQDDPAGPEARAPRNVHDLSGPHGPEHEAQLHALLEREASAGQSLEWSGNCQQCRDELARLRELGALLDDAAADRRRTLDSARALRIAEEDLVASFVRGKLAKDQTGEVLSPPLRSVNGPRLQAPAARGRSPQSVARAASANGPRWQHAWAPWVVTAAGIALMVGWWLRSILPDSTPQGRGVTLGTGHPSEIAPQGLVDAYGEFRWNFVAPDGGSLVLRIWDNSRTDSGEPIHTIRLKTDQRAWRADNLWTGPGPESISWEVEALDSTAQFHATTRRVDARLRSR